MALDEEELNIHDKQPIEQENNLNGSQDRELCASQEKLADVIRDVPGRMTLV